MVCGFVVNVGKLMDDINIILDIFHYVDKEIYKEEVNDTHRNEIQRNLLNCRVNSVALYIPLV